MNIGKLLKSLCIPSKVYLVLSVISILALMFDPSFAAPMGETQQLSIFKGVFVLVWTYVLDLICKSGYTNISWFFVLLPFIVMLAIIFSAAFSCDV